MAQSHDQKDFNTPDANRDPLTGAPGSHPVGTGVGAAVGGIAAGAAAGTLAAGPIGTIAGAAVGAVLGGLGGKAIAEQIDPTVVDEYWRDRYEKEPYYEQGLNYDDYAPAYRLGANSRARTDAKTFDDFELELAADYDDVRGSSKLEWERARNVARAGYEADYRRH